MSEKPLDPEDRELPWALETYEDQVRFGFQRSEILMSEQSAFQTVDVIQTPQHGRVLMCDGSFIASERDEHINHEMIAHVPLFLSPGARHVLVLGGGNGGTAREILKHPSVEKCVVIEMDEAVVRAAYDYLPLMSAGLRNPRTKVIIADPVAWVEAAALGGIAQMGAGIDASAHQSSNALKEIEKFDVICVDAADPLAFIEPLYGESYYANLKLLLREGGIIVSQAESPFYAGEMQAAHAETVKKHFKRLHFFNFTNLTYPGGLWSISFASDAIHPIDDLSPSAVAASGLSFQYYNAGIHEAAFLLPEFQKQNLKAYLNPL